MHVNKFRSKFNDSNNGNMGNVAFVISPFIAFDFKSNSLKKKKIFNVKWQVSSNL